MSLLHGKQLRDETIILDKLKGTGLVTFTTATMSFDGGARLFYADAPTSGTEVANKTYVDDKAAYFAGDGLDLSGKTFSVVVDSDALEITGGTVSLKSTITGSRTFENNVTVDENLSVGGDTFIDGNLTVSGSFSYINTTELLVEDNYITLNSGLTATGFGIDSGIEILRGGLTAASILWNEGAGYWQVGLSGSESTVITEAGTGLDKSGNQLFIDNTGVAAASYGSASSVATFTVNAQGQLTAAQDVVINITSGQVNDFGTAVSSEVFETGNFVDSNSVDFTVTNGASVTADVIVNADKGLAVSSDGVEIKVGLGLTFSGTGELEINASQFGVQGASNGLTVSGTSEVELGGDLTRDTSINGNSTHGLEFTGINGLTMSAGNFDITTTTGSIDMQSQTSIDMTATSTIDMTANANIDIKSNTADINIDASNVNTSATNISMTASTITMTASTSFNLNINNNSGSDALITDSQSIGLVYGGSYSANFVTHSLVDKFYVDNELSKFQTNKAEPVYDKLTVSGNIESGDDIANVITTSVVISEKSRFQVFVNGLQVSVGYTGTQVAHLPVYSGGNFAVEYDTTKATDLVWHGEYPLETGDLVEVFYEAIPQV
jgi:hypothetical protein